MNLLLTKSNSIISACLCLGWYKILVRRSFDGTESECRPGLEHFARAQEGRRIIRFVRRIGIVLRLETNGRTSRITPVGLPLQLSAHPVARVHLHTRFGGIDIQYDSGLGRYATAAEAISPQRLVHDKGMIVSLCSNELIHRTVDPIPYAVRRDEIERRPLYLGRFAVGNGRIVCGEIMPGLYHEGMIMYGGIACA